MLMKISSILAFFRHCNDFILYLKYFDDVDVYALCTIILVFKLSYSDITIPKVLIDIINLEQCHSRHLNPVDR